MKLQFTTALTTVVTEVLLGAPRTRLSNSEFINSYCKRGAEELATPAAIHFTAPCADLSLLVASHLAKNRQALNLIDRLDAVLSFVERPYQHCKFQCNLEFTLTNGDQAVLGFSETAVHLFFGSVEESRYRSKIFRAKINPTALDQTSSFVDWFVAEGREGLKSLNHNYDLDLDLTWHLKRNRLWRFHLTRWKSWRKAGPTVLPLKIGFK